MRRGDACQLAEGAVDFRGPTVGHDVQVARQNANAWWCRRYNADGLQSFGYLRVINEDRIAVNNGFGFHSHREFEIFTYMVRGEIEHKDSMGNVEIIKRGDIQLTSASTGIRYSEICHGLEEAHLIQIWTAPWQKNLEPKYCTRHFSDDEKTNNWVQVVAPANADGVSLQRDGIGPAPVHSYVSLWATVLLPGAKLSRKFPSFGAGPKKKAYLQIVQNSGFNQGQARGGSAVLEIDQHKAVFREGDGAFVYGEEGSELQVENTGKTAVEILRFDVQ
ncbi:hypothetical protein EWM64_g2907 [Hericium alpestre]|uniref:Pirin N-terminal domain-containing protein n=1 Tax=Hericium alpestre TaxID=135208 RepID=A0A4Z0A5B0_9AGAM|nr:hypothetical protein EWM64_g2907 [Hericium alpestre]